ncbi:hypothetical protein [Wolbachia endosymbiont of Pentidionis agamae]|uniref:hypothetical protein n=1 Tax=Wolbachia endosymbiont of Pentidionis agamae TaxID=3110435 RepID=UPI002FD599D2
MNDMLVVLDFDNTIVNGHMHGYLEGKFISPDEKEDSKIKQQVESFLKEKGGIKNEKKLKVFLKDLLKEGVNVAIASFTKYTQHVEYCIKHNLDLSDDEANSIKVIGWLLNNTPDQKDSRRSSSGSNIQKQHISEEGKPREKKRKLSLNFDLAAQESTTTKQESTREKYGKNFHILCLLKEHKKKYGELPKAVVLLDDDENNIKYINGFNEMIDSLLKSEDKYEKKLLNIDNERASINFTKEDMKGIKFIGVLVPKDVIKDNNESKYNLFRASRKPCCTCSNSARGSRR